MQSVSTFSVFPSVAVQIYVRAPWWEKWQHFACPVRVPLKWNFADLKKVPKYWELKILPLFQIFEIPLLTLNLTAVGRSAYTFFKGL